MQDHKWTQLFKYMYPGKQCLESQRNTSSLSACILQIIQRLSLRDVIRHCHSPGQTHLRG